MRKHFLRSLVLSCSILMGLLPQGNAQVMELTYSQSFTAGLPPTVAACNAWNSYCASLSASYTYLGFRMYGSVDPTGVSCTNATIATGCAAAMRLNTVYGPNTSDGQSWIVGSCGSGLCTGVTSEITNTGTFCQCNTGYTIRPSISNNNWGGINGTTCNNPTSQTMAVTFYIQSPVTASISPVNFNSVLISSSSVKTTTISGSPLTSGGTLSITPPPNFEVSLNGSTWFSGPMPLSYSGTSLPATTLYIRFTPTAEIEYSASVAITGGGMPGTANIGVLGSGASTACSGTPTAGIAYASPTVGNASTDVTLTLSDYTTLPNISFQWQSSPTGTGGWTPLAGATNSIHTFTGISSVTYYRCVVTCSTGPSSVNSNVVSVSTIPAVPTPTCVPDFLNNCTLPMQVSISSITGSGGTGFSDPATTCAAEWVDNSATHWVSLKAGTTYAASVSATGTYYNGPYSAQIWIDFNNDGAFSASETVGGLASFPTPTMSTNLVIPSSAPAGTYRMRIAGNYTGCCGGITYPAQPGCATTVQQWGQARDYKVTIEPPPPCIPPASQPYSLVLNSSFTGISGSFTAPAPAPEGYLIVMTTSSVAPTTPVNGTVYTPGTDALGGKIISTSGSNSFSVSGLPDGTPYWFWIYAYTATCSGVNPSPVYRVSGPLNGTISTQTCAFAGPKTVGPGGDYPTIAAAVSAINTIGLGANASIEILPSYTTETFPIVIGSLACQTTGKRLVIRPHSTVVAPKTITGNISSTMISLNGAKNVVIDGRVGSTGTTKILGLTNQSTSSPAATIQFLNDACDNMVQYMTLKGSGLSTVAGVVHFSTTTGTTGSDRDTVDNCDISEATANLPYNCIYATGTTGKENSNNVISNNNLSNFFVTSSNSSGITVATGNMAWTITGNNIFQTATRAMTSGTMRGIWLNNTTSGNGFEISNNNIGGNNSSGSGTMLITASSSGNFRAISCNGSYITPNTVQGNTVKNITLQSTSTSTGQFYGIDVNAGSANVTGNVIGGATGTGFITRIASSNGTIAMRGISTTSGTGIVNITNNTIGGVTLQGSSTAVGVGMYCIEATGTAVTTITNNTIGSTTTPNSIATAVATTGSPLIYGIFCSISSSTTVNPMVTDNVIANITNTSAGSSARMAGMMFNSSSSPQILRNVIRNISNNGTYTALSTDVALTGIMYTGSTGTPLIVQNTVNSLSMTNAGTSVTSVTGILYTAALNGKISQNRIFDLRNAGTQTSTLSPPKAIGIFLYSPSTSVEVSNNMITLGMGSGAPSTNTAFNGIMAGLNSGYILRCYHNTVYIGGTATSGSIATACLHRGSYSGGTFSAPTMEIRNNIFMNARTGATNLHYAIANCINYGSSTTGWSAANCNNNILNAANAAAVGWWSTQLNFSTWKTSSSNCDLNSFSGSALTFANLPNGDLHINMGTTPNDAESHCNIIPGYTVDYDNDTRPGPAGSVNGGGAAPDIGADEFDGVANNNIGPAISYTAVTCGNISDYVFTATIAHPLGVATGAVAPRVYYRKNAGAFSLAQSAQGVLTSGTAINGVWTFTVSAAAMGGLALGNTASFFVIAQSTAGLVASNTNTSMVAANVNSISTYPTNPTTYSIGLGGTYTVGSGGNYTTLTAAANDYNARCLAGPVTFSLISPTYASESVPILISNTTWANSVNTLLIRPANGVNATITSSPASNSQIRIYQAKYVTIDGINDGSTSLTLNNTYTSNFTAGIQIASAGTGAFASRNITIKNLNIKGSGSPTISLTFGIIAMSSGTSPTTTSGADNDTITIEGNTITQYYNGIYAQGTSTLSTGGLNDWVIRNNIIGPPTYNATTNIGNYAIFMGSAINPTITGNTIRNVGSISSTIQAMGIYFTTGINGFTIDSNNISGIASLSTSSSTSSNAGIYIGSTCINGNITRNIVKNISSQSTGTSSARGITINTANSFSNLTVANNMVSDIRTYGTTSSITICPTGIALDGTNSYVRFYHNTISLNGTNGGNGATFSTCFYTNSGGNNVDFRNNVLINKYNNAASGTDKGYAFYTTSANTLFSELDYNNFYVEAPNLWAYTSGDRPSLSSFQSSYGRNANSKEVNAVFVDPANDLHLTTVGANSPLASGQYVSAIPKDIDGTNRNTSTPVMGAHEVTFCNSITAGTVSAATAAFCTSGTTTITATGATAGESMQWKSSTDGTTFTNIAGATTATYVLPSAITVTTYYRFVNKCAANPISDSATATVTINPLPNAIGGNQVLCTAGTLTLTNTTPGGTWTSGNTAVANIDANTGVVSPVAAGTSIVTYKITATGCQRTVVVTVNPQPTIGTIAAANPTLCVGATVTLNATGATGTGTPTYNWSGPNAFSATTSGATRTLVVSAAAAGEYSLNVTYPGLSCVSNTVVTSPDVVVNTVPTIGSITTSSTELCAGATLTLNALSATGSGSLVSYNWSGPNAYSNTTSGATTSLTVATGSSGEYSVSVTYTGSGCTSTAVMTDPDVTVNATPAITSLTTSATPMCVGTPLTLTANGGTGTGSVVSYNWSGPNGYSTTSAAANATFTTTTTAQTGTYSVTVTYPGVGCTSAPKTAAVAVNNVPTLTGVTASSSNLCVGAPLSFTATGASGSGSVVSYNWSGPNSFTAATGANTTGFTTSTVDESGIYSVTVTYTGTGCTSNAVATSPAVTVNTRPTVVSIVPSTNELCTGTPLTFTANGASGTGSLTSYNWSGPNAYSNTSAANSVMFTPSSTAASGNYSVSVTYTGTGCTSNNVVTSPAVTVNAAPSITSISTSSNNLCVGTALTLTANGASGSGTASGFNWTGPNGFNQTTVGNSVVFTPTTTAASGNYSVSVSYSGAGCTSAAAVTSPAVTVNALPTVAGITPSVTNLCIGSPISFTAGAVTGAGSLISYNWSGPNGFSIATGTNNTGFSASTTAQSGNYSLTVTYPGTGCTSNAAVTSAVSVHNMPTVAGITPSSTLLCTGTSLTLTSGATTGGSTLVSYNWTGPNGYSAATTANEASFTPSSSAASGSYSLTVTYSGLGCTSNTVQTSPSVTVNALPALTGITALPASRCIGETLTLTANGASGTGSVLSYNWSGPAAYSSTTGGNTQSYVVPGTTASGSYSATVTYQGTGCTSPVVSSSAVTVHPQPAVFSVTGGGSYCAGGTGVAVGLANSEIGINYQLYNGATTMGSPVAGSGAAISFGQQTMAGTYTATGTNAVTGCSINMTGSAFINITPTPNIYTVTGGGTYCEGTGGFHIGLSSSDFGISYQLYLDGAPVGGLTVGTGAALDFGVQLTGGTYTVKANPGSSCEMNMASSGVIVMHPAPTVYNVSGGGTICQGDPGVHINLSWSVLGINYQLYRGATAVGAPVAGITGPLDMGLANIAGTYTVLATNASTGCMSNMTGNAVVNVNSAPTAYTVTGGGSACSGAGTVLVGLSGSDNNITYQLYNGSTAVGSPLAGTGGTISFGAQNVSGVYSVSATNTLTSCSGPMNGTATVNITAAPVAYNVTGGGQYCAGGTGLTVGVAASNVGVMYQLYYGSTATGSPIPGSGSSISFGTFTAAGTYSVQGTNILTSCTGAMAGTVSISINPLPDVYNVTGGGPYCSGTGGVAVGLSFSASNINYQLYNGSTAVGAPVAGTGGVMSFGNQVSSGTYTVRGTNSTTGCVSEMSGSATVTENPLPAQYTVTGGGNFCTGGTGVAVGLNGSQSGVNYQLYNGVPTVGSPVAGTGSAISFGMQGTGGTYTVLGTVAATGCSNAMNGSATVTADPLPSVYSVTGGGSYCENGSGVEVGLNNSNSGINYQLYVGGTATGAPVAGTGLPISFGLQTVMGTYTVQATNATTSCTSNMFGSATVIVNPLPIAHNVTGTGSYCSGGTGLPVGLANSTIGVSYQLYNGIVPVGGPLLGTGSPLNFGSQTAGTYTVQGTNNSNGCTNAMAGNATITANPLPTQFNVNGGGTYCQNSGGVPVGLIGSQTGINYQLYNGASAMGSPVAGTGSAITFGSQTLAGTYTVMATNATTMCTKPMTSSATVIMNPAPTAYNVTGGGAYCSGGSGVSVGLSGSNIGTTYQLYRGATVVGSQIAGTGSSLDFGMQTVAGNYTVMATNNSTTCTGAMAGSADVTINALPIVYNMTGGGGYCVGGTGVTVGLANSQSGVNYQLYRGASAVGTVVPGTGSSISFGLQTVAGVYSVQATDASTACTRGMGTTTTVFINALPAVYNVTGGGGYCVGGPGAHIGVESSEPGVDYQLYMGASAIGAPMPGSGAGIDYGEVFVAGTYSVKATNSITGCVAAMNGSATVIINTPPSVFSVTGGGAYCSGGTGVAVGVSGSQSGVNYTLYNGTSLTGTPLSGTGGTISFGSQLFAGTYTVRATNATSGCVTNMTGSATVVVNALPAVVTVTGGGSYCPGAGGVNIGLSGSASGVTYQLYMGAAAIGSPITGTGAPVSMGVHTTVGTYSATATVALTGCMNNMTGTATVSQNALPVEYAVTGGGNYCSGSTGVTVGLSGSEVGVSYKLYNGPSLVGTFAGTGSALSFGIQTATGSFSVSATNTSTGCVRNMLGSATIVVNDLPTVYLTTGGGNYCQGGNGYTVVLNGSQSGIDYQLFRNGAPLAITLSGTGSFLDYGLQTVAGFYTVKATNATTGCVRLMAGSPEIVVHPLPTVFSVTGGGSYCAGGAGVEIGLSGSTNGMGYRLYNGGIPVGTIVTGNGSAITFGAQPAAGVYSVQAVNSGTGCTNNMTGSATVMINALPAAYNVTGGGGYCTGGNGVAVGLSNSATGVSYQLYRNGVATGAALSGTGSALDFGLKTATGTYTIKATNGTTSCMNTMTGAAVISINPAPAVYIVTGGGSYCAGDAGVEVGLDGSETGVNYTLYNGATVSGDIVAGTGAPISFGLRTAGTYTVMAANSTTTCQSAMTSSANISVNALPVSYVVSGGGTMCAGTAGVSVTLSGSQSNVSYTLYNGSTATGSVIVGTGSAISFGLQGTAGTYSVMALDMMTNCTNAMTGTATVSVNPAPAQYAVTGGGTYCAGGTGVVVGLTGSQPGLQYNLYKNGVATGVSAMGTGAAISFAPQFVNGNYTVMAVNNATSCTRAMTGSATVSVNAAPATFTVAGGGAYCAGGTGVSVSLSGSAAGTTYRLYMGATQIGSAVAGTGGIIGFGAQQTAGVYTVMATSNANGCTAAMAGNATVVVNALPATHAVTGGGSFCAGSTGVHVGLAASEAGVTYKLYKGTAQVGSAMAGTGAAIDFGIMNTAGVYTIGAVNSTTACSAAMSGSATVQVNALPVAQTVVGGGSYCAGGTGVDVALGNSQSGVNYQLYLGSSAVGDVVAGTGNVLSFGMQTATGVYSVAAVNATTTCARSMTGTVSVSTNALPTVFTVAGGGSYCAGGNGINISLSGSQAGVTYHIYRDGVAVGVQTGTGAPISLGNQTMAGVYTVMAQNATSCTANMAGSATISINTLPTAYAVSSGGAFCAGSEGVSVTLNGSQTGVAYRLYNGATAVGSIVDGTGSSISFGMMPAGSYSVRATNTVTSCTAGMTGTAVITVNSLPVAYTMTGGGGYCDGAAGVPVGLAGSQLGMSYQLYSGTTAVGPAKTGTGGPVSFGMQQAGNYTVMAMNTATGCTKTMTGSITAFIHDQPMAFDVMGGGSYCAGGNGLAVMLGGSQVGINYRLYRGTLAIGTLMPGTGSNLNFGAQTVAGDYTVKATNATTGCISPMAGMATISINALPQVYAINGGGSYCAGGNGVEVGLENSADGVTYQLYMNTTAIGDAVAGTGSAISFGQQTGAGAYRVVATDNATSCVSDMGGTATVAINALPVAYTLSSSSAGYCQGTNGVQMMLNNSQTGVTYRLFNGASVSGSDVAGTDGNVLSFGFRTAEGTYSVLATNNTTGCTSVMSGMPSVVINPLPAMFAINGGGSYCADGEGVAVGLSGSQVGISYQLYKGGVPTSTFAEGTGGSITFGEQLAGSYSVKAANPATGCRSNMTGNAMVVVNALPAVYAVTGGGSYCSGGAGVAIGLANSNSAISYQLYKGTTAVGPAVAGGGTVSFGMQTEEGIYTVKAMNTATGCGANMSGAATVAINATPAEQAVTGGGALCIGSTGVTVGLAGSATGVNYRLYKGTVAVGSAISGTGDAILFPALTTAGTYTVMATSATNGCAKAMTGSATVIVNQLPAVFTVTGGGAYCESGAGVEVALSGSENGITYKLVQAGSEVGTVAGNGNIVTFGLQTTAGSYSVMAMSNATGCTRAMNGTAAISIMPTVIPSVTMEASVSGDVCQGTLVTYTTSQEHGGTAPSYVWKVNGTNVGTSSSYSYTPANGDMVSVEMTSNANCATPATVTATRAMTVSVKETPVVTVAASTVGTLCSGNPVTFTASALFGGDSPVFDWIKNGSVTATGASFTYVPTNGDVISVRLTSNFACVTAGLVTSADQALTVLAPQAPTVVITANPGTKISQGQSLTLTAVASNTFQPTYQWFVNGAAVHNATSTTYTSNAFNDQDTVTCRVANNTPCGEMASFNTVLINVETVGVSVVPTTAFDVRVIPNPTKGNLVISGTIDGVTNDEVTIEIANMLGQVVYKGQADVRNGKVETRIDLSNSLANGMYLLNLHAGANSRIFHITLQR